ncbi:MAG: sigma-54 dependent transcriptional regulator [Planctomycetota bacterium]
MSKLVAVIDDDSGQAELIASTVEGEGYKVVTGKTGAEAVQIAVSDKPALFIMDIRMPVMDGLTALPLILEAQPEAKVILVTGFIDVRDAVKAIRAGAVDYIEKPIDLDELCAILEEQLGDSPGGHHSDCTLPEWIVAQSAGFRKVTNDICRVAPTDATVLLMGESGSGKEVLADLLHEKSRRSSGPIVKINCASIPSELVESELFGHEKGAFTGAVAQRQGCFREAEKGTLFLDEIGELPMAVQAKLLRALESKTVRPVGRSSEVPVDVRIVAATNRELFELVKLGSFREDLFYRLNVFSVAIPPLRDRRDDILPLAARFCEKFGAGSRVLSAAVQRIMLAWKWPGNVRELRNVVERALILSGGGLVLPEHLPSAMRNLADSADESEGAMLKNAEKATVLRVLNECGGNKTQAARKLGISRRALIYKLRGYGM